MWLRASTRSIISFALLVWPRELYQVLVELPRQ
jgi:hypothetical protein